MFKILPILLLIIISFCYSNCSDNKNTFKIEKGKIDKEVFYGETNVKIHDDSLIKQMALDIDKAFSLSPIKLSISQIEIRVYFINPFTERFFREQFKSGELTSELFNCKTDRRRDSLFMKIGTVIKTKGEYNVDSLINLDSLPTYKLMIDKDTAQLSLDDGALYLIQIKNGSEIKMILIDKPAEKESKDADVKYINRFIKSLNRKFSFSFYEQWEKIADSAFIKL